MDFAKKQLEKYGWTEGKGLGKGENGISDALKPKIKKSLSGLGHNVSDEFTNHWWNKMYNNASDNISINLQENGEVESFAPKNSISKFKTDKSRKNNKNSDDKSPNMPLYFQTFVRKAVLANGITVEETTKEDTDEKPEVKINVPTDDELFVLCGKRTVHKGARHGLKSNGKLSRLEMQDKIFLEQQKSKKESDMKLGEKIVNQQNQTLDQSKKSKKRKHKDIIIDKESNKKKK